MRPRSGGRGRDNNKPTVVRVRPKSAEVLPMLRRGRDGDERPRRPLSAGSALRRRYVRTRARWKQRGVGRVWFFDFFLFVCLILSILQATVFWEAAAERVAGVTAGQRGDGQVGPGPRHPHHRPGRGRSPRGTQPGGGWWVGWRSTRKTHTRTHTPFAPASRIGADGGSPGLLQSQDMEVQVSGLWLRLCHRPPLLLQHPVLQSLVRCDGFSCRDHLTLSLIATPPPLFLPLLFFCLLQWRALAEDAGGRHAVQQGARRNGVFVFGGVPRKNSPLVSHCCSSPTATSRHPPRWRHTFFSSLLWSATWSRSSTCSSRLPSSTPCTLSPSTKVGSTWLCESWRAYGGGVEHVAV